MIKAGGIPRNGRRKPIAFAAIFILGLAAAITPARADNDVRVLIVGDSIMQALARALQRDLAGAEGVQPHELTELGSGLSRTDLFDWHGNIERRVKAVRPSYAVVMMGANDNQPMRVDGAVLRVGSPEWAREYGRRVGRAMDILLDGGVRSVHWLELPDMRDSGLQRDVEVINDIVRNEAEARSGVSFEPTRHVLNVTPGDFKQYVLRDNGMPLIVRARDGVHLNRQGADRLSEYLVPIVLETLGSRLNI